MLKIRTIIVGLLIVMSSCLCAKTAEATAGGNFGRHIDPSANNTQFCDVGPRYRTAIFYLDAQL